MKLKKIALTVLVCLAMTGSLYAAADKPVDLAADVLEYDAATGIIEATGSVRMLQDNAVVTGAKAQYNSKTEEGYITGGVIMHKDDLRMEAANIKITGNAHVTADGNVMIAKGDRVLTGPQVDYFMDKEYVIINSNAKITMPDGTMTADKMEAYLGENRIIGTGNVHILSEVRKLEATSDTANYYGEEKGKIILAGNAVAVQDGNTLRGKTLTLYLDGTK